MKIFTSCFLLFFGMYACKPDPLECSEEVLINVDGVVFEGHINLCNGQGTNAIYEPGTLSVEVEDSLFYFEVRSSNSNFNFLFRDTTSYQCIIRENMYRDYELYNNNDGTFLGYMDDTQHFVHFIILDTNCSNSSFFEGIK